MVESEFLTETFVTIPMNWDFMQIAQKVLCSPHKRELGCMVSVFGAMSMQQSDSDIRAFLIAEAFRFINRVVAMPGIRRVAIIGSLTSIKTDPNDADLLVTVDDEVD